MAICSVSLAVFLILPMGASGLVSIHRDVITDDFLSVSCPRQDSCLLLDKAGNVWFSSDGGKHLSLRASLPRIGLARIRMSGLADGWALDSRGSLWKTRDGGRNFNLLRASFALPRREKATVLILDKSARPWLGTSTGAVYSMGKGKTFHRVVHSNGGPVRSIALGPKNSISTLSDSAWISHWKDPSKRPVRARAQNKDPMAIMDNGKLIVLGACSSEIGISLDRGKTWKKQKAKGPGACLKPLLDAQNGTIVMGGLPGKLLLIGKSGGKIRNFDAGPKRIWRDASRCGSSFLLVGDGGARGRLEQVGTSGWKWTTLGKTMEGVSSLGKFSIRGAVACTNDGKVSATENLAGKWSRISKVPASCAKLVFVDKRIGFAISGVHEIVATTDGGASWKSAGRWPDLSLRDLFFTDSNTGWAVGGSGALVRTSNAGKSWTLARMPGYDRVLYRVLFLNRKIGYTVGAKRGIFKSLDGGKTWKRLASGRDNLRALFFLSKNFGWVGGDAGLVMHTADGGKTWTPCPVPSSEPVRDLSFVDGRRGLAATGIGGLWVTVDGAKTWSKLELNTRAGVTKVYCRKKKEQCFVGGQRGLLLFGNPFSELMQ